MFNIPNILTLMNLVAGCLAIYYLQLGSWRAVLLCFGISLLCDFLDGFVARLLKQQSPLGGQLDSLADVVSFGVMPAFAIFYALIASGQPIHIAGLSFIYAAAAAMRLGKFNLDTRQTKDFLGLNTPAATIGLMGLYYLAEAGQCSAALSPLIQPITLLIILIVTSAVLLIDIPMLSFKPDTKHRSRTIKQVILVLGLLIIFAVWKLCGLFFMIVWYILFSLINLLIKK